MAKSESEEKVKKHSSFREGIEPSAIFISDFGAMLLLALFGLIALIIAAYAFAFVVGIGLFTAAYSIAFGFTYLTSFGEMERAKKYARTIESLKIKDPEGIASAKKLVRTRLYFAFILFALGAEEVVRFVLNTGPATLEIWAFRFGCVAFYMLVLAVFANRFADWRRFKGTNVYKENLATLKRFEASKSHRGETF